MTSRLSSPVQSPVYSLHPRSTLEERKLTGGDRGDGGRGCCAGWREDDAMEGTGAVLALRLYIEVAGSEADGRQQCRVSPPHW